MTVFEKIINKEIPAQIEYENKDCIVIHDLEPKAPIHLLIIPKKAIPRIDECGSYSKELIGELFHVAALVSKKLGLDNGFRLVINNGVDAGETVPHLHIHLLAKRKLEWPPG